MSAIITITFNPALDKSIWIPILVPYKKIRCSKTVYGPGGGGINVARAIKKLGGDAIAVYLAGGSAGKKITALLAKESIQSLVTETEACSRENLIIHDDATGKQYLFDMQAEEINSLELEKCLHQVKQLPDVKYIVVSGSLPPGVSGDVFTRLALIAKEKNAKLIVDTSGEPLKNAIKAGVYLIKPNLRELGLLVGKEKLTAESAELAARELIDKSSCEVVVVSMGGMGALVVTEKSVINIMPPPSNVKSTVGAGDSLVAGTVLCLSENKSLAEAVQYGVACGTAATMEPGTELCAKEDADQIYCQCELKQAASSD
jgi:6-phosphofructokinase 2